MVNLVKNILDWSSNQTDDKLLKNVKKQLKDPRNDPNQLRQFAGPGNSTLMIAPNHVAMIAPIHVAMIAPNHAAMIAPNHVAMIAPIHAAALSNSPELFKLVLETKGVDPDIVSLYNGKPAGGVWEFAVTGGNLDIIRMVLEKKIKIKEFNKMKVLKWLAAAVECDRQDIVELLLSYSDMYPELTTSACLVAAISQNKRTTFTHFLAKSLECLNEPLGNNKGTLIHLAVRFNKVEMLRELIEAGCDVNIKDNVGHTPFMFAVIAGSGKCDDGCYDQIISELLSSESIDLDITVKSGTVDIGALELLTEETCQHVRNRVEQAYARKNQKRGEASAATSKKDGEKLEHEIKMKICWSCLAEKVSLPLCKGCMKARYCADKCQEDHWPVHGTWCKRKMAKIEEKRIAKEEEQ